MDSETPLAELSLQQLMDEHAAARKAMEPHRARMATVHEEITRREHAEERGKMNPDVSLDQGVRL